LTVARICSNVRAMNDDIMAAATLILLRDTVGSHPEILMLERGAELSFVGGAMVFPGGKVDEDDALVAANDDVLVAGAPLDPLDAQARVAALRETIEEVGLAPAVAGLTSSAMIATIRKRLADRQSFGAILGDLGLRLDLHQLHPFARWVPRLRVARLFDTRFYIARAPGHDDAMVDGSESSSCRWDTAAGHIALADTGARKIVFPTRCNLERVGQVDSYDAAIGFANRYPIEVVSPWLEERENVKWLQIPDHLGYPNTTARLPSSIKV
jgi:8-oxo-dGTP pyrophosphatase MutT (NUDIX family)